MLRCILGERKSGKSVFAEEQIKKKEGSTLYVATLPNLSIYEEVIARHQKRRPGFWRCIELFNMSAREIAAFPYTDYRYVVIDNLSYYVLFQRYYNGDVFLQEWDERFLSLIHKLAADSNTMVYAVDAPVEGGILEHIDKEKIICRLFSKILDESQIIERFYYGGTVCRLTAEEGKDYLFRT